LVDLFFWLLFFLIDATFTKKIQKKGVSVFTLFISPRVTLLLGQTLKIDPALIIFINNIFACQIEIIFVF